MGKRITKNRLKIASRGGVHGQAQRAAVCFEVALDRLDVSSPQVSSGWPWRVLAVGVSARSDQKTVCDSMRAGSSDN